MMIAPKREDIMTFYSIGCSPSAGKNFVLNQAGDSEECRAIRLFLKKPADGTPPPFDIHYRAADDVTEAHLDRAIAVPGLQTIGFSKDFVDTNGNALSDIFEFVPCQFWLHDKAKFWPFFVVRFRVHTDFYDRDATRAHQRKHGGLTHIYKASGLTFDFAAHDSKRSYFTFTQHFVDRFRPLRTGLVITPRDVKVLEV